jgi:hypothetical protein
MRTVRGMRDRVLSVWSVILLSLLLGCSSASSVRASEPAIAEAPTATASTKPTTTTTTTTVVSTTTTVPLVGWAGPVEHLFFHTLVIRPELAFTADHTGKGFLDYFVTVGEFKAILEQLYANGWTLVDIHDAIAGTVEVPAGRKPLVVSEDDVNYYAYEIGRGLGARLVLDADNDVKIEERDDHGAQTTDNDLIPIVDQFVATHPLFSSKGAKGVIALTGYEGVFGERTNLVNAPDWADSVARARRVADRLKATGWTLASHSYGHIDLKKDSETIARRDTDRWLAEVSPIIGPTDVYVYPFGAVPATGSRTVQMLRDRGFTIQCDIDIIARTKQVDGVAVMSRRHIDGLAFATQPKALAPFFDVTTVQDTTARRIDPTAPRR